MECLKPIASGRGAAVLVEADIAGNGLFHVEQVDLPLAFVRTLSEEDIVVFDQDARRARCIPSESGRSWSFRQLLGLSSCRLSAASAAGTKECLNAQGRGSAVELPMDPTDLAST